MECEFCYNNAKLVVLFPNGREICICKDVFCLVRVNEIAEAEAETEVHSITELDAASPREEK